MQKMWLIGHLELLMAEVVSLCTLVRYRVSNSKDSNGYTSEHWVTCYQKILCTSSGKTPKQHLLLIFHQQILIFQIAYIISWQVSK